MKMQKSVTFVKKNLKINIWKTQNIVKLLSRNSHYTGKYGGAAHSICNLKYSVPKKIPVGFHNGSNYDYHFIINELAEEFKKKFSHLGKNSEKHITFTVPIEKTVTRMDKNGGEITKDRFYLLQFIDSARVMARSWSHLVNNLSEGINRVKCKYGHDGKNVQLVELNISVATVLLNKQIFKMI